MQYKYSNVYEGPSCLFHDIIDDSCDSQDVTAEKLQEFFMLTFTLVSKVVLFQQKYAPYSERNAIQRPNDAKKV